MNLAARMTLDTAGFMNPMRGVMGGLRGMIGLAAGAAGVTGVIAGLRSGLKMGSELSDLKDRTGASVKELVLLRQAFDDTGVGAQSVPIALQYMQKALSGVSEEGRPTSKMFQRLGLDMEALKKMSPTDQLTEIGKAIAGLEDEALKTDAAMTIFGRSGAALKQFFADPRAIEKARDGIGSLAEVLERDAALLDNLDDAFGRLRTQTRGMFVGLASQLAPALNSVVESLKGIDLTHVGVKIGRFVSMIGQAFAEGNLSDLIGQSLTVAFENAGAVIGDKSFWLGAAKVAEGAFWGLSAALIRIFKTPIDYISAGIRKAIDEFMEALGKTPKLGAWLGLEGHKAASFQEHMDMSRFMTDWLPESMGEDAERLFQEGAESIRSALDNAAGELTPNKLRLAGMLEQLERAVDANIEDLRAATLPAGGDAGAGVEGGAAAAARGGSAAGADADRWARLGLFVGAAGGPAVDYQRRTATASERLAALAAKTNELLAKLNPSGPALWAPA